MLRALVNEARLRLDITTTGPLLIKSGYVTISGADMTPVQTYRNGHLEVYLPGTSLKGVFRSHLEKVINSINAKVACNPLSRPNDPDEEKQLYRAFCGSKYKDTSAKPIVYAGSCPTCRVFGSTAFIGRIAVEDAYLPKRSENWRGSKDQKKLLEHRDSVAIDRLTGGASSRAKFDLEPVTADTTFTTTLTLRNFEIWQLGMIFILIQDMQDGLIRIGSGRSRGLGTVTAKLNEQAEGTHQGGVVLSSIRQMKGKEEPDDQLWGLGRWLDERKEQENYRTQRNDMLTLSPAVAHTIEGIRATRVFKGDTLTQLKTPCIDAFLTRIGAWKPEPSPQVQPTRERR